MNTTYEATMDLWAEALNAVINEAGGDPYRDIDQEFVPQAEAWIRSRLGEPSTCRHCHQPIIRHPRTGHWHHDKGGSPFDNGTVGCRAFSFTDKDDWDDSLPRHWVATPVSN